MARITTFVVGLLLAVLIWPLGFAKAEEPVVLTVTGAVESGNRGGMDPFEDVLFGVLGESFDSARTFTRRELLELPQHSLETSYPDWPRAVRVSGPRLLDVLQRAEADGARVAVQAMDGYAAEFAMSDITQDFLLALEMDGSPLATGGRGPVWLVFPPESYEGQDNSTDAGLAWAVFHIKVVAEE